MTKEELRKSLDFANEERERLQRENKDLRSAIADYQEAVGDYQDELERKDNINTSTTSNVDTFNDIWNAIDCIDYRLREVEEKNMNEYEKAKIKHISRMIIGVIFMIVIFVNAIFIKSKWLSTFLFGFIISQLIESIVDFIIADISWKKIQKELDEMYKDDETYQRLFKKH